MNVGTAGGSRLRQAAPWSWLALLVALAYGGAVFNDYVWDDVFFFGNHVWVHDLRTALAAAFDPLFGDIRYVRPLPLLTLYAETIASGRNPAVSHGVNLVIHWGCSVLVFLIARRALGAAARPGLQKTSWMPLALASLFAVHPALSEAPIWISSRFDLMATFWILLALWVSGLAIRDLPRAAMLGALFFIGALCKESVVVFPLLLGAYALLHGSASREDGRVRLADAFGRRNLMAYAALVVGGLAYLLIRYQVLSGADLREVTSPEPIEWFSRITTTITTYLQLTVAPFIGSSPHHPWAWPQDGSLVTHWQAHVIALSLAAVVLILAAMRRPVGWWLLAWLAAYLPVMHLIPLPIGQNIVHQRFMYLPTAALLAFAPYVLARLHVSDMARRASLLLTLAMVVLSIPVDRSIVKVWRSDLALWSWATQARPESVEARENMIWAYIETGMYEEAEQEFMYIVRSGMRTRATVAVNMGTAMYRQREFEEALHYYSLAEPHQTSLPTPFRSGLLANLSITHALLGNAEAAREYLPRSLETHPRNQVAIGHLLGFCDGVDVDTSGFEAKDVELAQDVRNNTRMLLQEHQPELQSKSAFCPVIPQSDAKSATNR